MRQGIAGIQCNCTTQRGFSSGPVPVEPELHQSDRALSLGKVGSCPDGARCVPVIRRTPRSAIRELSLIRWGLVPREGSSAACAANGIAMQARTTITDRAKDRSNSRAEVSSQNCPFCTPRHVETTSIASARTEVRRVPGCGRFFFTILFRRITLSHGILTHRTGRESTTISTMEDAMKVSVILLSLALAGAVFAAVPAGAQQAAEKKDGAAKETKWQGHVIRINKDESTMDIRGGSAPSKDLRKVAFDSSTEWTKRGKPAQQDEFKEASFVIVLGHVDDKGVLHAKRIDLRLPR